MMPAHRQSLAPPRDPPKRALRDWLKCLLELSWPGGVTYVGAGSGTSDWIRLLHDNAVPNVALIEADESQFELLQRNVSLADGWRLRFETVAATSGTALYYRSSNGAESGLVDPAALVTLWPNIKRRQEVPRATTTLATVLPGGGNGDHWLIIDCLPAGAILGGAGDRLDKVAVVVARVVLDDVSITQPEATLDDLDQRLTARGFRCVSTEEDRHPALGYALYVRDLQAANSSLALEIDRASRASARLAAEYRAHVADLRTTQEQTELRASAALSRAEQLESTYQATLEQLAQRERQLAAKTAELSETQEIAAELRREIHVLRQQLEGAGTQVVELGRAKAAAERSAVDLKKLADERSAKLAEITAATSMSEQKLSELERLSDGQAAELATLRAAKTAAEQSAAEAKRVADSQAAQIAQLTSLKASAELKAAELKKHGDALSAKLAEATAAKATTDKKVAELEQLSGGQAAQLAALTAAKTAAEQSAAEAKHVVEAQAAQIAQLNSAKAAAELKSAELKKHGDALSAKLAEATAAKVATEKNVSDLKQHSDAQAAHLATLNAAKAAAEQSAAEAKHVVEAQAAQIAQLNSAKAAAELKSAELKKHGDALSAKLAEATAAKVATEKKVSELKQLSDAHAAHLATLSAAKAATEQSAAELQKGIAAANEVAGQRLGELIAVKKEAEQKIAELKQLNDAQVAHLATLTAAKSAADQKAADLKKVGDAQTAKAAELTAAKIAAEQRVAELKQLSDLQTTQVAAITAAKAAAEQKSSELKKQIDTLSAKVAALTSANTAAEQEAAAALKSQSEAHARELDRVAAARVAAERRADESQQRLATTLDAVKEQLGNHLRGAQERDAKLDVLQRSLVTADQKQFSELKQSAAEILQQTVGVATLVEHVKSSIEDARQQVERQGTSSSKLLEDISGSLGLSFRTALATATRQMQEFITVHRYLETGTALDFQAWAISPDSAAFLLSKVQAEDYDLLVDFGSGTSTALLAKALQIRERSTPKRQSSRQTSAQRSTPKILSFEHDPLYLERTHRLLEAHGLREMVDLHHVPLTNWTDGDGMYLYYDCDAVLAKAAQRFRKPANILAFVDGPPGRTCPQARYPAVPFLGRHLGQHRIDVILDDADREDERRVVEAWRRYWQAHSVVVQDGFEKTEKGLYFAACKPDVT